MVFCFVFLFKLKHTTGSCGAVSPMLSAKTALNTNEEEGSANSKTESSVNFGNWFFWTGKQFLIYFKAEFLV